MAEAAQGVRQLLAPLLARVEEGDHPLLFALAERVAADRYRSWAAEAEGTLRVGLLECAEREEEIARKVESLFPDAEARQQEIRARIPEFAEISATAFAGRSRAACFALQAAGERLGGLTWRALARKASSAAVRALLLECAELEERNAELLEANVPEANAG